MTADRMPIAGSSSSREPIYWESGDGAVIASAQPGPPFTVGVDRGGVFIIGPAGGVLIRLRGAGAARWLGLRLIEAATIYEREVNTERMEAHGH